MHAAGPAAGRAEPADIDIVSTHATGTTSGDAQESQALRQVFAPAANGRTLLNNTKSFIGHAMGAAGALELAGNLPAFDDGVCHATINLDQIDPDCAMPGLVANQPREMGRSTPFSTTPLECWESTRSSSASDEMTPNKTNAAYGLAAGSLMAAK